MPHRYFTTDIGDGQARLWGQDAHHLAHVMRARLGDEVILCDGLVCRTTLGMRRITKQQAHSINQ